MRAWYHKLCRMTKVAPPHFSIFDECVRYKNNRRSKIGKISVRNFEILAYGRLFNRYCVYRSISPRLLMVDDTYSKLDLTERSIFPLVVVGSVFWI